MNIAMFTNTYLPHVGGVARSISTYEEELRRRGFQVNIVAPEYEGAQESTEQVFRVPAIQKFNGSDFSLRVPQPWLISNYIDKVQPDLIHTHHPFVLGDAGLRTAYERQLPLVFTHHTMYEQYTHYLPLDSEAMKRFAIQMATEYCNLCDHVIAPSQSIENLLRKRGVQVPVTTIPTGISLEFYGSGDGGRFREKFEIPSDAVVIGHVGRLAEEKNLTFLATAVAESLADHPQAVFLVVGNGDHRSEMERILSERALPGQFLFTGCLTGGDLADAYAAMDVFAFSSQSETQGMVIAEALAAGNPVLALDGPGVREVVEERNGILLDGHAGEAEFAEALARLLADPERLARMSEAARASVVDFGIECCADRLGELYRTLIREFQNKRDHDLTPWEKLQGRLEAEWNLLTEKALAIAAAVSETEATKAGLS
jgi:1,2-diacylglycerol 3-alpha-glucosyltransferase